MAEKAVLSNHPINTHLRNILKLFDDEAFQERLSDLEPEFRSTVRAIELFSRQTSGRILKSSDSEVSQNGLRQIATNLQNVWNELNSFNSNGDKGHITNASNNFDGALNSATWTFFSRPPQGSKAYGESVESVAKAADTAIRKLQNRASGVASRFTAFENKVEELEGSVTGVEGRLSQLSKDADAQLAEIKSEFASIKTQIEQERQSDRDERKQEFSDFFEEQRQSAETLTKKISDYEEQAKNILQIVGNIGLTGNYQNRASSEKSNADNLRMLAIGFFVIGAIILGVSVYSSFDGTVDTIELIARTIVALTVSAPAIYLAKESARHRSNSDRAKQTELELASLTPFLDSLPAERRQEVVESLANSYFGRSVDDHKIDHPIELTTEQLTKLLIKALDSQKL
jgi:hypothetical protein